MTNKKGIKRSLLMSALALLLCVSMLIGSTFAWFTDSVTSAGNIIKSGTLEISMKWADGKEAPATASWKNAADGAIFNYDKWEPGYTEARHIAVKNEGTLALKYQLTIVPTGEVSKLADVIDVYYIKTATQLDDRADLSAYTPVGTLTQLINNEISAVDVMPNGKLAAGEGFVATLVLKMQESAGNEYQDLSIGSEFAIQLLATQLTHEEDSFDDQYDKDAPVVTYKVNPSNVQDYLDGKYASLKNAKLVLEAGDYGVLYLGRPTKYVGSNTEYFCETHDFTTTDAEAFKAHYADGQWHTTPKYSTNLEDLMIVGEDGAKVAGLVFSTGHSYGDVYDYVRDIDYTSGSAYYSTAYVNNVTVENVAFTGQVDICTSDATTVVDGVAFRNCSFTTGGTASANGAAIRYYNEANNGNVKNLTVEDCEFTNCYQGIYAANVNGVSVIGSTFDTLGHNAIALQSQAEAVNLKSVVIKNNVMKNVADRVIRFNNVGADSQITIQYNAAVNSGDDAGEVIKASSIAAGATFDVKYNDWGGKTVVNDELKDAANTEATYAADNTGLNDALTSGADTVVLGNGNYIIPDSAQGKTLTIVGNGNTVIATQDDGSYEGCDYSLDGATVTFEGVVINTDSTIYTGYARCKATYNNCTINGSYTLYGESVFNNCTFNVTGDYYNVWTWGAKSVKFNNCTFNTDGKSILVYNQSCDVYVNGCTFNDSTNGTGFTKSAFETGVDGVGPKYNIYINDTAINGFAENDKCVGYKNIVGNKNSMTNEYLNIVIDGVDVY